MNIQYDKIADALYIYLGKGKVKKTKRVGKNTLIDFGAKDKVLGVEFYKISSSMSKDKLQSVSVDLPVGA